MSSFRRGRTFVFSAAITWGFFASAADAKPPVRSLLEIREAGVVIQKWDLSCGAAALATVLNYHFADPIPERTIVDTILARADAERIRRNGGFSLLDLQEFAQNRGYAAEGYGEVTLEDLAGLVPAIVPTRLNGYDHFVVVRAVDDAFVYVADPGFGQRRIKTATFARRWIDNIAFVVSRPAP